MTKASAAINEVELLVEILQHKRPHNSATEQAFIKEHLMKYRPYQDALGNLIIEVPGKGRNLCYSCHTDTVHRKDGYQAVFVRNTGIIELANRHRDWQNDSKSSNCLGADDGAGVWLMMQMIDAGKPGLYIFHRGEECGASGSKYIADKTPEIMEGIDAVIAFDRYGYESIITHQRGRTCSDEFAKSLGAALPMPGSTFKPDDKGLFTDSRSYIYVVKECTNVSVGYFGHHSPSEQQDVVFLRNLKESMIRLNPDDLVFKRKTSDSLYPVYNYNKSAYRGAGYRGAPGLEEDDEVWAEYWKKRDDEYESNYKAYLKRRDSGNKGGGSTSITPFPQATKEGGQNGAISEHSPISTAFDPDFEERQKELNADVPFENDDDITEEYMLQEELETMAEVIEAHPLETAEVLMTYGIDYERLVLDLSDFLPPGGFNVA